MDDYKNKVDLISNLQSELMQKILNRLPLKDAANTSLLSREWRYKWTTISKLLLAGIPDQPFVTIPCLSNFKELTYLELHKCRVEPLPPPSEAFPLLKFLKFSSVFVEPNYDSFISSCPLLETLEILRPLFNFDKIDVNLSAPKLKYLNLDGNFLNVRIEYAPSLISVVASSYQLYGIFFFSSSFDRFIGKIPCLESLQVSGFFAKYLSIGIKKSNSRLIQYNHLKIIKLHQLNLVQRDQIQLLLRLILNSPKLEKLDIVSSPYAVKAGDEPSLQRQSFLNWRKGMENEYCYCPEKEYYNFFRKLKTVKIVNVYGLKSEMELVKFILERAPKLDLMILEPCTYTEVNNEWFTLAALLGYPNQVSPIRREFWS